MLLTAECLKLFLKHKRNEELRLLTFCTLCILKGLGDIFTYFYAALFWWGKVFLLDSLPLLLTGLLRDVSH